MDGSGPVDRYRPRLRRRPARRPVGLPGACGKRRPGRPRRSLAAGSRPRRAASAAHGLRRGTAAGLTGFHRPASLGAGDDQPSCGPAGRNRLSARPFVYF